MTPPHPPFLSSIHSVLFAVVQSVLAILQAMCFTCSERLLQDDDEDEDEDMLPTESDDVNNPVREQEMGHTHHGAMTKHLSVSDNVNMI